MPNKAHKNELKYPTLEGEKQVALITGSSSGIGLETSVLLAENGFHTYAAVRNLEKSKALIDTAENDVLPLQAIELDVNSDISVKDAISKILYENKRIDVVVNNAGYALVGPFEDSSMDEIKAQFETNFFGAVRIMQAALPTMIKQGYGRIVNVSSLGGRIAFPFDSAYHGTKFALEGLSESIQYEVQQFGIKIILIEPGVVKSRFWDNLKMATKAQRSDSPYLEMMQKTNAGFVSLLENGTPPEEVAKVILNAVTSEHPELRYVVGNDAATLMEARKNMTDAEFQKVVIRNIIQ
ncbi:MAG: short-chain dehydrogenase/reductase [Candidatus Nitrosopolaris wilkensis]|nr:MAG: short-chain dehydrogenase/reductase [Candidatus Nitrosopolaris wilkensis]